jgi:hypothetical protein
MGIKSLAQMIVNPSEWMKREVESHISNLPDDQQAAAVHALQLIQSGQWEIGLKRISNKEFQRLVTIYAELSEEQRDAFVKAVPLFNQCLDSAHFAYHSEEGLPVSDRLQIARLFAELSAKMTGAIKQTLLFMYLSEVKKSEAQVCTRGRRLYVNTERLKSLNILFNDFADGAHQMNALLISELEVNQIRCRMMTALNALNNEQKQQVDLWVTCMSHDGGSLSVGPARKLIELLSPTA